jgi:lysozyme
MLKGIDVSKWQGAIDWPAVAADGVAFAIVKATEGALKPGTPDAEAIDKKGLDPSFRSNFSHARAAGLVRGAYHFGRPDLGNGPDAEAEWFYSVVGPSLHPGDLIALDLESGLGNLAPWAAEFMKHLHGKAGFNPLFYASPSFMDVHGISYQSIHGDYGLWEADWTAHMPAPGGHWPVIAIWQYGSAGTVKGIGTRVDADLFNGDRAQLLHYGKPAPAPEPAPEEPPAAGDSSGSVEQPPPAPQDPGGDKADPIELSPSDPPAAPEPPAAAASDDNFLEAFLGDLEQQLVDFADHELIRLIQLGISELKRRAA